MLILLWTVKLGENNKVLVRIFTQGHSETLSEIINFTSLWNHQETIRVL